MSNEAIKNIAVATYENIRQANETINPVGIEKRDKNGNIVKKDYAEVNQRIKAFRMCYPNGFINSEMVSNDNGVCLFRATVGFSIIAPDGEIIPLVLGTGTAYEKENSSYINKTSYIENCETSAIGRALGMAGFGIDTSIASLEEVQNAINNQSAEETPKQARGKAKTAQTRKTTAKTEKAVKSENTDDLSSTAEAIDEEKRKTIKQQIEETETDTTLFLVAMGRKFKREVKAVDEMSGRELDYALMRLADKIQAMNEREGNI